jgi:uncharacterized protein YfaS (alpha-2-macroglobulin family)
MLQRLALLLCLAPAALSLAAQPALVPLQDYARLRAEAETRYGEKSWSLAHELYQRAARLELEPDQRRWVEFRLGDTRWRAAASTTDPDPSERELALEGLAEVLAGYPRPEDRDEVWALVHESLGDAAWTERTQNWGLAWSHYQPALDWWAHSSDLERARRRYLDIVWRCALPGWRERYWGWDGYPRFLDVEFLEKAQQVAREPEDVDRAHYLVARAWMERGHEPRNVERVGREIGALLERGKAGEWYDDALFALAQYYERGGRVVELAGGGQEVHPDLVRALELYRRITAEFEKGEVRCHDQAVAAIKRITEPALTLSVERFFLPGTVVSYQLGWRNAGRIELGLHPVDLTRNVSFARPRDDDWLERLPLAGGQTWTFEGGDDGLHEDSQRQLELAGKPAPGAYVLVARAGKVERRVLVVVTDAALSVKATGTQLLVWATEVLGGRPIAGAELRAYVRWHDGKDWRRRELAGRTAADGTATFQIDPSATRGSTVLVTMKSEARQTLAGVSGPGAPTARTEWTVYAQTDRAAYRPGDAVQWSAWARTRADGSYRTPAGAPLVWEIVDPMGSVVAKGEEALNAFGALWGRLETTAAMALGEYQVRFFDGARSSNSHIGRATLFRLEEYKLPEFEVTVDTPDDPEHPDTPLQYVVGDRVEAEVKAEYYSGGAVAEATVEVFVFQRPRWWMPRRQREFPWFHDEPSRQWWGGPGQQVLHETLRTDAEGRARVAFDTPFGSSNDLEYTIEARVTDASRREIVGTGTVVVGQRTLRVELATEHAIHRPGADVDVTLSARDLNENPVAVEGTVRVTRERWIEVWRDPAGRDVTGGELLRMKAAARPFPPPDWTVKFRGYESEPVLETRVRTGADGQGALAFTPPSDGYYRVAWTGTDARGSSVTAETAVFVADDASRELGYLPGGVELLVDRDTARAGEDCAVLLMVPSSGRFVLFTVEAEDLLHHEVVEMSGQVKLLRLPIAAAHVPNVTLGALSVFGGEAFSDREELIVPPVEQFLDVTVRAPAEDVDPGSAGSFTVEVRDHAGEPVETLVTFSVVDEAIAYVQQDYAVDPRRFFHGQKRPLLVRTGGSFDQGRFRREEERDERQARKMEGGQDEDLFMRRQAGERGAAGAFLGQDELSALAALGYSGGGGGPLVGGPSGPMGLASRAESSGVRAGVPMVRVRSDFRSTALWLPDVVTDSSGSATVTFSYPDSTTRWRALARACDAATRVGEGTGRVRARLPLTARLQAPRFFVVGDTATLSGVLQNDTDDALTTTATLDVDGLAVLGVLVGDAWTTGDLPPIVVPAHGVARVDWRVAARAAGDARVRLTVVSGDLGDALERRYPVEEHGLDAFVGVAGRIDDSSPGVGFDLDLPAERRVDSTRLEVLVAPSLAVTMLDALPYLIDYPYGCVEQTLSRFVPAVIVARTLREAGLSPEQAMERVFGGVEGEYAAKTHPKGKRSLDLLDEISRAGLERLYDFQHADGSWAWWKEGDGDPYMTAYVLWGLALARDAGLDVRVGVVENGVRWLTLELVEAEDRPDLAAWLLHAVAVAGVPLTGDLPGYRDRAFERLWADREHLNAYGRALLALSAQALGRADAAAVLVDNLRNGVKLDESPDTSIVQVGGQAHQPFTQATAHWGPDRTGRHWSDSSVETTAFVLRALLALDPHDALVAPTMNWLVKNRRGAQWSNTRDTAITVLALNDYLTTSGELAGAAGWRVTVNGTVVDERSLTPEELLAAAPTVLVDRELVRDGPNRIEIERTRGEGSLYFTARATFFSLEDPIPSRGNEIFVRREYWRLAPRPTLLAGVVYDRVLLEDGATLTSGERVEVVLTFEAKNDLEYLVFEDDKPAGLEAVGVRSGEPVQARELKGREASLRFEGAEEEAERLRAGPQRGPRVEARVGDGYTGRSRGAHQELRDRRVAFFLDRLPQGTWELRHDLRAEVPGRFHALPTRAHAMYVPEIRANGEELRLVVADR